MNETERAELAALLREVRTSRFRGSKKAAYTAAGVNAATWDRAESGESIKEHTRVAIVSALWPDTGGDWTKIPTPEDLTTWADMNNPRYDARHMARRIDELEERVSRQPDVTMTTPDGAVVTLDFKVMDHAWTPEQVEDFLAGVQNLVIATTGSGKTEAFLQSVAARRGVSEGQQLRRVQDEAGEENQDRGD